MNDAVLYFLFSVLLRAYSCFRQQQHNLPVGLQFRSMLSQTCTFRYILGCYFVLFWPSTTCTWCNSELFVKADPISVAPHCLLTIQAATGCFSFSLLRLHTCINSQKRLDWFKFRTHVQRLSEMLDALMFR